MFVIYSWAKSGPWAGGLTSLLYRHKSLLNEQCDLRNEQLLPPLPHSDNQYYCVIMWKY